MQTLSEPEYYLAISKNITALMDREGLSQTEFARRIGVEQQTVSAWIKCKSSPSPKNMEAIMRVFSYIEPDDIVSKDNGLYAKAMGRGAWQEPVKASVANYDLNMKASRVPPTNGYAIPPVANAHPNGFFFSVDDDSMNLIMLKGSLAFVDPNMSIENGHVGLVKGPRGRVIRRVFFAGDTIVLHPESDNQQRRDEVFSRKSPEVKNLEFIGPVVWHYIENDPRL